LALPSHLPVVETIIEPNVDTTGMFQPKAIRKEWDFLWGLKEQSRIPSLMKGWQL